MADRDLETEVRRLTVRIQLAEEVIRAVEDDAMPAAALVPGERYRAQYPREPGGRVVIVPPAFALDAASRSGAASPRVGPGAADTCTTCTWVLAGV